MKRNQLLELLNNYFPLDQEECIAKKRMLAFIKQYPDCFERSLEVGHITASAWVLNKDESKVLLMHHAKLQLWVQLGGHCDGDSDVLAVALKEAQEESGISNIVPVSSEIFDIDIHLIAQTKKEKAHYHYDVRFLVRVDSDQDFIKNDESLELCWFDKDRDKFPTDSRSVVRMFEKWIQR